MRVKCLQVVPAYGGETWRPFTFPAVRAKAVHVQCKLPFRFRVLIFSGAGDLWVWFSPGMLGCAPRAAR